METVNFRGTQVKIKYLKQDVTYHMLSYTFQRKGKNSRHVTESFDTVAARNAKYEKYLNSVTKNNFRLYTTHTMVPIDIVVEGDT